jgi:hypothetical protein
MRRELSRLEKQLEKLVEGSLSRLLGAGLSASEVSARLARAMEDGIVRDAKGQAHAPDQYALTLNPAEAGELSGAFSDIVPELSKGLLEAARDAGYLLGTEPRVTIASDPTLPRREVRVVAWHSGAALELTKGMPSAPVQAEAAPRTGAFLIINGDRHFPLDRAVINIGRRLDNQIILEDPHISRTHAQLRWRDGRFVLFDLGSTSGTKVNGRPVKQHLLIPGDVIVIGSTRMVYGEDPGGPPDSTPAYRAPFPPRPAGHQRTIVGIGDEEKTEKPE